MHITKGKADWIDILKPGPEDLNYLRRFGFHENVLGEIVSASPLPQFAAHDNYIFLTHHFPMYDAGRNSVKTAEADFIITKHHVITVHYDKLQPLHEADIERSENSLELAHSILRSFLDFEVKQLAHIKEKVENLRAGLLTKNREHNILDKIWSVKAEVREFEKASRTKEPVLDSFMLKSSDFWGPNAPKKIDELLLINRNIRDYLDDLRNTLEEFERLHSQMMGQRTRKLVGTFVSISAFTAPFLVIGALFGILLTEDPLVRILWYIVEFISLALSAAAFYLKIKKPF